MNKNCEDKSSNYTCGCKNDSDSYPIPEINVKNFKQLIDN